MSISELRPIPGSVKGQEIDLGRKPRPKSRRNDPATPLRHLRVAASEGVAVRTGDKPLALGQKIAITRIQAALRALDKDEKRLARNESMLMPKQGEDEEDLELIDEERQEELLIERERIETERETLLAELLELREGRATARTLSA